LAATVTGSFVVLDRASRPIRRIRDEAIQADLAVTKLGNSLDRIGTREQRQMMDQTTRQIRQLAGDSRGAASEAEVLGQKMEKVATPQTTRNIATQAGAIKQVERASRDADRPISQLTRGVRNLGGESRNSRNWLERLGGTMLGMRTILMGALIPAIGLATQGLSALGGGLVALIPRLSQISGLAPAAGTAIVGIGLAAITAKLAFNDLGKAMAGNAKAQKALTPEAKSFIQTLKQYKPVMQDLRQSAQRGLFPGLETAIRRLNAAVPVTQQLLTGMGRRLGSLAAGAAGQFTGRRFLRDFQMIGDQGMHVVTQLGRGLLNLVQVVRNFMVAGLPFTHWLTDTIYGFTAWAKQASVVGRETGSLTQRFQRTQQALTVLGHVTRNIFQLMHGVMQAATDTSGSLWDSIDRVTKRWADWANSTRGQGDMRRYFESIRAPLHEIVGFIGDLTKGLAHMAGGSGFTRAMQSLRAAIPSLASGLSTLANTFGPAMFEALSQTLQLVSTLVGGAGGQGPLMIMLSAFNNVLRAVNSLTRRIPGLGMALSAAVTIVGLSALVARIRQLASSWFQVASGARAAAVAQGEAAAAGGAAGVTGAAGAARRGGGFLGRPGWGRGAAEPGGPGLFSRARTGFSRARSVSGLSAAEADAAAMMGLSPTQAGARAGLLTRAGLAARGGAARGMLGRGFGRIGQSLLRPFGMAAGEGIMGVLSGARALGAGARGLRAGGSMLGRGMAAGAEFMAPIAVLSGIGGAIGAHPTRHGAASAAQRAIAFGDSASFGLTGALGIGRGNFYNWNDQMFQRRSFQGALGGRGQRGFQATMQRLGGSNPDLRQAEQQVSYVRRIRAQFAGDTSKQGKAMYHQLTQVLTQSRGLLHNAAQTAGSALAIGFGQAFNVYSRREGIHKAMQDTTHDVTARMRSMGPAGAKALGQNMVQWAREQARANPKLWGEVRNLEKQIKASLDRTGQHVKIVNGQILDGSQTQWKQISAAMTSPVEQAKAKMATQFTAIQSEAAQALILMGYDRGTARNIVAGMEAGGSAGKVAGQLASSPGLAKNPGAGSALQLANKGRRGGGAGLATGGRIGGLGSSDNVYVAPGARAAPGELIVNRHTERDVNRDLVMAGRAPLGARVGRESRSHNMATGGAVPWQTAVRQQRARGSMGGLHAGISGVVQRVLAQWPGLSITSTTGGRHAANSYHYRGMAADLGGNAHLMNQAAAWIGRTMGGALLEGIHNPNLSIKNGQPVPSSSWGPAIWAEHLNHIHLAAGGAPMRGLAGFAGGGGTGRAQRIHLARMVAGLGVPSALLAAGHNAQARGMEGLVNARLAQAAGGGGPYAGGGSLNQWLTTALRLTHHYSPGNLAGLRRMAMGESGGNPNAIQRVNDVNMRAGKPARGLLQTIPQTFNTYKLPGHENIMDPVDNAIASIRYQFARYGRIVGHAGYSQGGRVPGFGGWFQAGGRATYRKPTFIGVGDAGTPEHVDVTPVRHHAGQGSATGGRHVTINFHPGAIVVKGHGKDAAEELVQHVVDRLATVLDGMGLESEVEIS
jgi:hypothetical protein